MAEEKDNHYAYMPGCSLASTASDYEISVHRVADALDIKLEEIPGWVCCGGSSAHLTDTFVSDILPLQSLSWAEERGLSVVTPCPACFQRLKLANQKISKDSKLQKEARNFLGRDYKNKIEVLHFLQLFSRKDVQKSLKLKIRKPLKREKIVCYYGCLLARPQNLTDAEDIENPGVLESLIESCGGEVLDWSGKTDCCGANFSVGCPEVSEKLSHSILSAIKDTAAEMIVVACQLCQANLDLRQKEIGKIYNQKYALPVVYFTQIIGLVLGISPHLLGLDKHLVSPLPILSKT